MNDRAELETSRAYGLRKRHETRLRRAIRREVAEEIALALLEMADQIGDGEQRELFYDLAKLAREIGSKETP